MMKPNTVLSLLGCDVSMPQWAEGRLPRRHAPIPAIQVVRHVADLVGGDTLETTVTALLAEGVEDVAVRADRGDFIDSSGLGGLIAARAMVVGSGGALHFGPVSGNVACVVDLAGVSDLLEQAPDLAGRHGQRDPVRRTARITCTPACVKRRVGGPI